VNCLSRDASGSYEYYHSDGLGSTRQLSNDGQSVVQTTTYDATGNRLRETELVGSRYRDYFYDDAAQLTRFTERQIVGSQDPRGSYSDDPAIQDDAYAYDAVGNRLSLTDNTTSEQILYTYDDFNKMLTAGNRSFTYDADGNCTSVALQGGGTTRTYHWGYNNELLQITYGGGGTNTFTYDGIGRRVTKTDSTGSYSFIYDGDRIISDGHAVYTRAGSSRLISERRGNNSQWYHADGLTSARTLTNSSQTTIDTFRYDVWGDLAERTGNTPTPHQFVGALGYERDSDSGLMRLGFRYYDPNIGRFISQDPIQEGVNWYVYTENNPVNRVDPSGLDWDLSIRANDGHAWIAVKDLKTGEEHTYGRWNQGYGRGNGDKSISGVRIDTEKNDHYDVERHIIIKTKPIIPIDRGYNPINNNCTTYAEEVWRLNTGESLSINKWGWAWHDPATLLESIKEANKNKPTLPPRPSPVGAGGGSSRNSSQRCLRGCGGCCWKCCGWCL
jgi:RHS repeat-associated protein